MGLIIMIGLILLVFGIVFKALKVIKRVIGVIILLIVAAIITALILIVGIPLVFA